MEMREVIVVSKRRGQAADMKHIFCLLMLMGLVVLAGCETVPKSGKLATIEQILSENPDAIISLRDFRDSLTVMPKARIQFAPQYPFELRQAGIPGHAIIEFNIKADGTVTDAKVIRATHALFGAAAKETIEQWVFEPARFGTRPVGCGPVQQMLRFEVN